MYFRNVSLIFLYSETQLSPIMYKYIKSVIVLFKTEYFHQFDYAGGVILGLG